MDKEFNIVTVYIVHRINKIYEKYVKTNAMNTQGDKSQTEYCGRRLILDPNIKILIQPLTL